jgi:hypothetical protein
MFVPDLLHEFELGVWKALFTHLIRILCAIGGDAIPKLNYKCVSTVNAFADYELLIDIAKCLHLGETRFAVSTTMHPI